MPFLEEQRTLSPQKLLRNDPRNVTMSSRCRPDLNLIEQPWFVSSQSPAEQCLERRGSVITTSPVSGFNFVAVKAHFLTCVNYKLLYVLYLNWLTSLKWLPVLFCFCPRQLFIKLCLFTYATVLIMSVKVSWTDCNCSSVKCIQLTKFKFVQIFLWNSYLKF